ncbi:MAG TPA: carbohydrate ABC transporter permease [Candidatus Choladousia intestinigallinarum]|nr:carbohydrate ABC transporter permease [Candidatus Choladousia intestinigallinarum]
MKKKKKLQQGLLIALMIVIALIIVFPVYVMVISSFKQNEDIFSMELLPSLSSLTLNNYITVFTEENLGANIWNSFFVATIVTVVALIFHAMSGYALARLEFKGKKIIFTWIISTLMIPFSVIMIPLFIIVKQMGLINNLWGIIIPMIPNAYGIFLFRQFFLGIPRELEESAKIDGASYFGVFLKIVLPLAKPIAVTLAVSFFLANWNNYLWPLIVAQDRELWLVQIAIANFKSSQAVEWNLVLAASCVASLPIIILFFIFQRHITEGIKTSGIKG